MARVIKLKESDITNIVKRILREGKPTKPGTGGNPPPHYPTPTSPMGRKGNNPQSLDEIGEPTDERMKELGTAFLKDVNTIDEFHRKYRKIYDMAPDWAQNAAISPDDLERDHPGDDPDDGPQMLVWYWIAVKVLIWTIIAWYTCCDFGWCC